MGNGMSQILPGLYLGNFVDAKDLEQLSRNKITHIVSIHESPQPLLKDITYLRIPLPDTPEANIKRHFKECISFIHQCRLHGGNCLVHCLAGISRSTTVVVAYVMVVTELSCQEVLDAIRTIRPVANPNPGFRQQLSEFGGSAARKVRRHLKQRYGTSPFNDEEEIKALLPAGREGTSRTEGAQQGLVPRARDIRSTSPFLLRVKRTFSCIPACLNSPHSRDDLLIPGRTQSLGLGGNSREWAPTPSLHLQHRPGWRSITQDSAGANEQQKEPKISIGVHGCTDCEGMKPPRCLCWGSLPESHSCTAQLLHHLFLNSDVRHRCGKPDAKKKFKNRPLCRGAARAGSVGREKESESRSRFRFRRRAAMAEPGAPMRLKEWLIAQIDSGRYPGLRWENRHRTLFRIPWKHAAKQDYRQQQDAALFKAWAIYKGKYQEGTDKADPSTWKTRLRCALNKSTDFQEVPERSQLDISEPYKVYQIVTDRACDAEDSDTQSPGSEDQQGSTTGSPKKEESQKDTLETDHGPPQPLLSARPTERGQESTWESSRTTAHGPLLPHLCPGLGYLVRGVFYSWNPTHGQFLPRPQSYLPVEDVNNSDCWLHIRLYYCDVLVKEVTTRTAEGCRITSRAVPADSERLYGPSCMEQIEFPPPQALSGHGHAAAMANVLERLLPHLERGVLLWVAPEGVFMKRQCQGRVYWNGPLAPHRNWPNKLEREKTYKLLDTQQYLQQLREYLSNGQLMPQYQIHLCFGEEYPTRAGHPFQKLIMAHVEPVFARELFHHAQRLRPTLLRNSPQPCAPGTSSHVIHVLKQLCQP
ncbi:PREDICTED: dual specificity protein phosphatase 15 [Lepidothrix coronata]|uniref:Dual specificity protein phosphatase 15 n=1 Tax=Lepidothrix coronata TaxID=321398 RepID=A0A6J0HX14_9PASS|nr:PREDICTED: dual specificity protein phosphatase 15 [Lepidothrix coronata]